MSVNDPNLSLDTLLLDAWKQAVIDLRDARRKIEELQFDRTSAFAPRELATMLAALRLFQSEMMYETETTESLCSMPQFEKCDPLTDEQIDELCKRLST